MADEGLEDVGLAVRGAALGTSPEWLPTIAQYGEGLFLKLDPTAIDKWFKRESTKLHVARPLADFDR